MALTDDTRVVVYDNTYTTYDQRQVATLCLYSYETESETAEQILDKARCYHEDENLRIMTYGEFYDLDRKLTLARGMHEVDEETFNDMLNVLPPLKWVDRVCDRLNARVNEFCMSEFDHGPFTQQYARAYVDGKTRYYSATVDYFDESTWIHNRL